VIDAVAIVFETFRISLPTVIDAWAGRLTRHKVDGRLRSWARKVLDRADVRLDVRGRDDVDWSKTSVVMSNHQSHFDIPIACATVPGSLRFIAKKELYSIPVFGRALREAGMIRIDRQDRERAIESLREAADALKGGVNVWIAPEGTRSRTGALGALKKGGFFLARETETPILPMCIDGAYAILPPKTRTIAKGRTVKVTFGRPIPTAGRERDDLMADVERFYRDNLKSAA
jgi:1-acyl-sn-glycerol-3-phosphate acyltransferase